MKLTEHLLSKQDPATKHTPVTRTIVSLVILGAHLVYTGFFGVLGAIAVYLLLVELLGVALEWTLGPLGLALIVGLKQGFQSLLDYWRNYGHGEH
ncbi:MAG: hypothetical protein AAF417_01505 [Pseudomonadota bacterium]